MQGNVKMRLTFAMATVLTAFIVTVLIVLNLPKSESQANDCPPDEGPLGLLQTPAVTATDWPTSTATPSLTPSATATATATSSATPEPAIPLPAVATPELSPGLADLEQELEQAIDTYQVPGNYAVAVTDLQTNQTASVNGNRQQLSGCSINFFLLLQVVLDMQDGRYTEDVVKRADELISATTWSSNAATALDLYAIAGDGDILTGVARVNLLVHDTLGLQNVVLDHPPLFVDSSLGGGGNYITAIDANKALATLWQSDLLTPEWRDYFLKKLAAVKPGLNYLTASLSNADVSHKNGFFQYSDGFVDNDMGIVRFSQGNETVAFAITFLSEGVKTKYSDVTLGQQLVRSAFAYFASVYGN